MTNEYLFRNDLINIDLRVGQQVSLELLERNRHAISFARRSASSISADRIALAIPAPWGHIRSTLFFEELMP
jgi:hypothetical protein